MRSRSMTSFLLLTFLLLTPLRAADLDEGRLDPAWYGGDDVVFKETGQIDYLWVKPGADLDGRTFHFKEWPEPEFIGPKATERDEDDRRLARQMANDMHNSFAEIWSTNGLSASTDSGDIVVEGRIVDCSTGNRAAKIIVGLGAGAGSTVIDVRFRDAATGDIVGGFHHRVVSGTSWSTTGSKFYKWVKKSAKELSRGFADAYAKGDLQKD